MKKKNKCYAVFSKKDKFLYGAFPLSQDGKLRAEKYLEKISSKNNIYYIKKV